MSYAKYLYSLTLIFSLLSCNTKKEQAINLLTFENTLAIQRNQEPILISKENILTILGKIDKDSVPVLVSKQGEILPFQLDDTNDNGDWDEFLTALDFKPLESLQLELKTVHKSVIPAFINFTNIRFGVGANKQSVSEVKKYKRIGDPREKKDALFFQMEGPAWENDNVGFRCYFDPRNGIDIFGKTTPKMVLDKVGLTTNYHHLENWGMDVLKVGNSLGAGAIAIKTNDNKLHRVTGEASTVFNIIKEGPLKSVFELTFKNSKFNNQILDITHRISISKGKWGYKSAVSFSGIETPINLVTGIVNLKPNAQYSENLEGYFALKSFGKQSENNDAMGMAILTQKEQYISHTTIPAKGNGIGSSYILEMKANNDKPTIFHFLTGWEKSDTKFNSKEGFNQMILQEIQKLQNPIVIK